MVSSTAFTICASVILVTTINLSSAGQYSGILSSLYKKAAEHNRPLILVLDNAKTASKAKQTRLSKQPSKAFISDEPSEVDGSLSTYLQLLEQIQKKHQLTGLSKSHRHSHEDSLVKSHKDKSSHLPSGKRDRNNPILRSRSPIVNNLLRMANRLNCDAKDDCVKKCKKITCVEVCAVEYECEEEEEEERNSCEDSESDCNDEEEKVISTRGERLVTESTYCARC